MSGSDRSADERPRLRGRSWFFLDPAEEQEAIEVFLSAGASQEAPVPRRRRRRCKPPAPSAGLQISDLFGDPVNVDWIYGEAHGSLMFLTPEQCTACVREWRAVQAATWGEFRAIGGDALFSEEWERVREAEDEEFDDPDAERLPCARDPLPDLVGDWFPTRPYQTMNTDLPFEAYRLGERWTTIDWDARYLDPNLLPDVLSVMADLGLRCEEDQSLISEACGLW